VQPIEGEDTASVQVRFENGAIGEILTSWAFALPYGTHHIHVVGEKGQIFGSDNTLFHLPKGSKEPSKRTFDAVDTFEAEIGHSRGLPAARQATDSRRRRRPRGSGTDPQSVRVR
jgi:predicted dehydrogenase